MSTSRLRTAILTLGLCLLVAGIAFPESPAPAPENTFSIVALPDTQAYSAKDPATFRAETRWIVDHIEDQRIVFVSHLGDIVDRNNDPDQWEVAKQSMKTLHGRVPYGLSVGNHDMVGRTGDSSNFSAAFPQSQFDEFSWYDSGIKNNADSSQTFSAAGMDFIILHIECNAPDDVLEWAGDLLERHSDRRAIITTHMYLGPIEKPKEPEDYFNAPKGRMRWKKCHSEKGNTPEQMWQKCFSQHSNLFLILAGDQSRTQAFRQESVGVHGNRVQEVMSDYRQGFLRIYRFWPTEERIEAITYSPTLNTLCNGSDIAPDRAQHQFSFPYRMNH